MSKMIRKCWVVIMYYLSFKYTLFNCLYNLMVNSGSVYQLVHTISKNVTLGFPKPAQVRFSTLSRGTLV